MQFIFGNTKPFWILYFLRWPKFKKSFLREDQGPFILSRHYHGCQWPDDASSWGISNQDIDVIIQDNFDFNTRKIKGWFNPFVPPATKLRVILDSPCLFVCLSVCPLTFRVRPVASTVQDGFFPYLVQMINSMRGCVACDDPWSWPISSRSFGIDLENRALSVASTILDELFLYLAQIITIIRRCVACCFVFFRIWKFEFLANLWNFSALTLEKNLQFSMDSFRI